MKKTEHDTKTIRLAGFGTFGELQDTIRSSVFGWMVKEASRMLVEYHSDLYHDAKMVDAIQGEWRGQWFVRPYGTWLGAMAEDAYTRGQPEGRHYDLHLYDVDGVWCLDVTRTDFEPEPEPHRAWASEPDETVDDQGRRVSSDD